MILTIIIVVPVDNTDQWLHYSTWNESLITFVWTEFVQTLLDKHCGTGHKTS